MFSLTNGAWVFRITSTWGFQASQFTKRWRRDCSSSRLHHQHLSVAACGFIAQVAGRVPRQELEVAVCKGLALVTELLSELFGRLVVATAIDVHSTSTPADLASVAIIATFTKLVSRRQSLATSTKCGESCQSSAAPACLSYHQTSNEEDLLYTISSARHMQRCSFPFVRFRLRLTAAIGSMQGCRLYF